MDDIDFKKSMNNPYAIFEELTEIINSNLDFYGHLISKKSNLSLITKIVDLLKIKTRETMIAQLPDSEKKAEVILDFCFAGMLSVFQKWFMSESRPPLESVTETIGILSFSGINGLLNHPTS
ncbi:MAG: TetR family transcriptional regulator C-terminal domain-containing protein [Lachnospiraceae bacterium]|nr:TetR family transcriptional regulator C-terminal domain-containing protein [Lachnospiraceae bacterium]